MEKGAKSVTKIPPVRCRCGPLEPFRQGSASDVLLTLRISSQTLFFVTGVGFFQEQNSPPKGTVDWRSIGGFIQLSLFLFVEDPVHFRLNQGPEQVLHPAGGKEEG